MQIYENFKNNKNKNQYRRKILITDIIYYGDQNFIDSCKEMADNNIFLTILGIS